MRLPSAGCLGYTLPMRSYKTELARHSFNGSRRLRISGTVDIRGSGCLQVVWYRSVGFVHRKAMIDVGLRARLVYSHIEALFPPVAHLLGRVKARKLRRLQRAQLDAEINVLLALGL